MKNFALFLSSRYLLARRRGIFTLLTTLISIGGIALGVAALIVTLAIMTGFQNDIRRRLLLVQPHIMIYGDCPEIRQKLLDFVRGQKPDLVAGMAPYVYGNVLIQSENNSRGVVIKGIEPKAEKELLGPTRDFPNAIGRILPDDLTDGVVLGRDLARFLTVGLNERVALLSPAASPVVSGFLPRLELVKVKGIFQTGLYEYDSNFIYTDRKLAGKLLGNSAINGWAINLRDGEKAAGVARKLQKDLFGLATVRSWMEMNKNLFSALRLEKIMMFLVLTLIVIVAAFNIISILVMFTVEKSRDIGILRALGASSKMIYKIFFLEGVLLGTVGVIVGLLVGLGLVEILKYYPIGLPADVYYINKLPVQIVFKDVVSVALAAFLISVLASIYPAYQATRISPIEVLRYG